MNCESLYPPNAHLLSDSVIGNVVQCSKFRAYNFSHALDVAEEENTQDSTSFTYPAPKRSKPFKIQINDHRTNNSPRPDVAEATGLPRKKPSEFNAEQLLMLHRERRRVIQQSYRKRLDKRAKTAEEGVKRLQREVRLLELQRERLRASIPTRSTPWNVIVEYFSLFRHGLESDSLEADSRSTNVGRLSPSDKQLQFVRSTMASDVVVKTGIGEEALLGIWKHANLRHQDFTTHLVRLELGEGDVGMIATVKCTFTITTATLVHEFPHLLNEEDEPSPLARQLLGQQVGVVTTVHFMWDASLNRMTKVTGVRYRNEMVTPLLKLLGNMQNVACVLRSTGITSSMG